MVVSGAVGAGGCGKPHAPPARRATGAETHCQRNPRATERGLATGKEDEGAVTKPTAGSLKVHGDKLAEPSN